MLADGYRDRVTQGRLVGGDLQREAVFPFAFAISGLANIATATLIYEPMRESGEGRRNGRRG